MNKTLCRRLEKQLSRLRSGDSTAQKDLYDLLAAPVYYGLLRMLRSEHEAKELTRETFKTLFQDPDALRTPEALLTAGARLVYLRSLQRLRRDGRLHPSSPEEEAPLAQFLLPSDYADDPGKSALVHRALDQLGDEERAVVLMHYYNDFSVEEIAAILDCGVAEIETCLHRANGALARLVFGVKKGSAI